MTHPLTLSFLILITVGLNTIAQSLLKLGAGQSLGNPYLISGVIAYGVSTLFYLSVLGKLNLSFAYPIIIGLTIITATLVGQWIFREKIALSHWIGIGLMVSGVLFIARSNS